MDFEPEEIKRKISIGTAFNQLTWQKNDVFLIDTPGDDNFFNETRFAAQVADSAILTVGAVLGTRPQTEKFVDLIKEHNLPCVICVTKMDRERANFQKTVDGIKAATGLNPVVLYLPIGAEDQFKGVVDIVANKALMFTDGGKAEAGPVPADLADEVESLRESLMESVAETDDELIEKFLEEGTLSDDEFKAGLAAAIKEAKVAPVCACASLVNKGSSVALDAIVNLLPSPDQRPARSGINPKTKETVERSGVANAPFSALVFKTMADPFAGRLTIFRVFSGTLKGDAFYNASKGTSERYSTSWPARNRSRWSRPFPAWWWRWPNSRKPPPATPSATRPTRSSTRWSIRCPPSLPMRSALKRVMRKNSSPPSPVCSMKI
jgi:elongation factor G